MLGTALGFTQIVLVDKSILLIHVCKISLGNFQFVGSGSGHAMVKHVFSRALLPI